MDMKNAYIALALLLVVAGCNKNDVPSAGSAPDGDSIVFSVEDVAPDASFHTKADVVETLDSFDVGCVTGSLGSSETEVWYATFTSDGKAIPTYFGDKFWPLSDAGYKFVGSNVAMTHTPSGYTVSATSDTDVVCAVLPDPGYRVKNTLSFHHVFARLGEVEVAAAPGYEVSGVSVTIVPLTGGTYDVVSGDGKTDGTGWSSLVTGTAVEIAPSVPGTRVNDVFLVPGVYELTATWTATRGDFTKTYVGRRQEVRLVGGYVNKLTSTLGGDAVEISVGVSVTPWDSVTTEVNFPFD